MGDALIGLMLLLHSITGATVEVDPNAVPGEAVEALTVLVEIAEETGLELDNVTIGTAPPFGSALGVRGEIAGLNGIVVYTYPGGAGYTAAHEAGHLLDRQDDGVYNGSTGLAIDRGSSIEAFEYGADYFALTWALDHGLWAVALDGFNLLAWRCDNVYPGWCDIGS